MSPRLPYCRSLRSSRDISVHSQSSRYKELVGKDIRAAEVEDDVLEAAKGKEDELRKASDAKAALVNRQSRLKAEIDGKQAAIRDLEGELSSETIRI